MAGDDSRDGEDITAPPKADSDSAIRKHVHAALFGKAAPTDVDRDGTPSRVGRFRTTSVLGAGGMGTVLAGFDDALERPVAVKLLHREIGVRYAERLRREAKALAKLSHPNVVTVYEVGQWQDRLFVAMEQVEGVTLGAWMTEQESSVDEVLDMFLHTGAGLVAAHGRGLVHRDFKPDNVIVGVDGRPRILDFGLVQSSDEDEDDAMHAPAEGPSGDEPDPAADTIVGVTPPAASGSLTETGTVLGTPAYMPAEQFAGQKTTEASDQFSFCVALWEALYGARPFSGRTMSQLARAVTEGTIEPPASPRGSGRLRRALERGLSPDPGARWPSMQSLIDELSDLRTAGTRQRRSAVLGGALVLAVGGTAWGLTRPEGETRIVEASSLDPGCEPAQDVLKPIWTQGIKSRAEARYFGAPPRALEFLTTELALLDEWRQTWSEIYTDTCESDEAKRDPELYAKRMSCLDLRLMELQTRTVSLAELSPQVASVAASGDYMPFYFPRDCANEKLVAATPLLPEDKQEALLDVMLQQRIFEQKSKAAYFGETGIDYQQMRERGEALKRAIEEIGYAPASADYITREAIGSHMGGVISLEQALALFDEGARQAASVGLDQTFVFAKVWALRTIRSGGSTGWSTPEVVEQLPQWEAALERSGWPIYGTLEFLATQAAVLAAAGDVEGGREAAEHSITLARETFGADHQFYRRTLGVTAFYIADTPLQPESERYLKMNIDAITAAEGPNAYNLLMPLSAQTERLINEERFDEALASGTRLLESAKVHHGEGGSHTVAQARIALARVHAARGDFDQVDTLLAKVWDNLENDLGTFAAIPAEFQAHYSAMRGLPDADALAHLNPIESFSPFTTMIIASVTPLLEGQPSRDALAAIDEAMKIDPTEQATALAQLVRGHVLERAGRLREAAEAFGASAACECTAINGAMVLYAAKLGQVRTLRALEDPAAEPIAAAFIEHLEKTSSSRTLIGQLERS